MCKSVYITEVREYTQIYCYKGVNIGFVLYSLCRD